MLTVVKRIQWWGVVKDKVLVCASARKEDVARVGIPVPITIQHSIEEVTTTERMFEVVKGMAKSDAEYRAFMKEIAAEDLNFEQELNTWMAENKHWIMMRATLGEKMFNEFVKEIKQWMCKHA